MDLLHNFYITTLDALKEAKNERLWFKTNTKLGKLYFDREEYPALQKILKQLHLSCRTADGEDDLKKGTQLLEIYALEIQMYTEQKNNKKLKVITVVYLCFCISFVLVYQYRTDFLRMKCDSDKTFRSIV